MKPIEQVIETDMVQITATSHSKVKRREYRCGRCRSLLAYNIVLLPSFCVICGEKVEPLERKSK